MQLGHYPDFYLQPLAKQDAQAFFSLVNDNRQYLNPWLDWVQSFTSLTHAEKFIDKGQQYLNQGQKYPFGIWQNKCLIGMVSFYKMHPDLSAELSYWLGQNWVGQGLAFKAALWLMDFGWHILKLKKIILSTPIHNQASIKLALKLGFQEIALPNSSQRYHGQKMACRYFCVAAPPSSLLGNHDGSQNV